MMMKECWTLADARNRAFAENVGADWQAGVPLYLSATGDWAKSPQGQLILLYMANQLPRMGPGYRRITVSSALDVPLRPELRSWVPVTTLASAMLYRMQALMPGEYCMDRQKPHASVAVRVGPPAGPSSPCDMAVVTKDWVVRLTVGDSAVATNGARHVGEEAYNPISAQWAVAALCALLYLRHSMCSTLDTVYEWTCWTASLPAEAPPVDAIDLGSLTLIGCGAVGNAFLEVLRAWPRVSGELRVYDPEETDETNLNRYLLLGREGVGRAKVFLAEQALGHVDSLSVWGFEREITKRELADAGRIVLAVDRVDPRIQVQASWPSLLLEAGTGRQWFHVAHCHRGLVASHKVACQGCLHGSGRDLRREEREASVVFVSAVVGAVLMRELLLIFKAGQDAAAGFNHIVGNAFEPGAVESSPRMRNAKCILCRDTTLTEIH